MSPQTRDKHDQIKHQLFHMKSSLFKMI